MDYPKFGKARLGLLKDLQKWEQLGPVTGVYRRNHYWKFFVDYPFIKFKNWGYLTEEVTQQSIDQAETEISKSETSFNEVKLKSRQCTRSKTAKQRKVGDGKRNIQKPKLRSIGVGAEWVFSVARLAFTFIGKTLVVS